MREVIAFFRSLAFSVAFYGLSIFWVLAALLAAPTRSSLLLRVVRNWAWFHRTCARWLLGQRVVIEGELPDELGFCVLKHEAMFETIDLPLLLRNPVIMAKKELLDIPLWGSAARAYGIMPIDRAAGASALRRMRSEALAAIAAGRPVCLFAEGTRVPPGEQPPLKAGFAGLYAILRQPVVPVAVATGRLNRRGRFIRYPGVIRYRFGQPIPPGLPREDAEAQVHAAINVLNASAPDNRAIEPA